MKARLIVHALLLAASLGAAGAYAQAIGAPPAPPPGATPTNIPTPPPTVAKEEDPCEVQPNGVVRDEKACDEQERKRRALVFGAYVLTGVAVYEFTRRRRGLCDDLPSLDANGRAQCCNVPVSNGGPPAAC